MLAIERRIALATLLERNPVLKVEDLARRFDVSTATIRRDFRDLDRRGLITRQYGGAVARSADGLRASPLRQEGAFSSRAAEHAAQKEAIACCALEFVTAGSTVIFDASTTVLTLAHLLPL